MLIISLFILLIYSSVQNNIGNLNLLNNNNNTITISLLDGNNRNNVRIGILILLYSLFILIYNTDIYPVSNDMGIINDIYLYNNLYILNGYNIYIIILMYLVIIIILSINLIKMSSINLNSSSIQLELISLNMNWINNFNRYYISIIIFNLIGMILFITSNNLISIFIGIELQSYSLYILTGIPSKSQVSGHNSLFYYLIGGFGSIIILYGLSLLYYTCGNIYLNNINLFMDYDLFKNNLIIGWCIFIFGLLIKIGAGPMYSWSILLYMNSNTIITSYISILPKISILSYIWFISYKILNININNNNLILLLSLIIIISLLIGSITGLTQIKIKSILGYSGLLNIGYFLLSILINNINSLTAYIIYLSQYSLNHLSIFLLLIIACLYKKDNNHLIYIYELKYIKNNLFLVLSLIIIIGSFIGIPPLFGFYGKYYLLIGSINNNYLFLSILLIISSIIASVYYLYFLKVIIIDQDNNNNNNNNNNYNNNNKLLIMGNTLSYIFSSIILIILFNFIQWSNILKGAYIISWLI